MKGAVIKPEDLPTVICGMRTAAAEYLTYALEARKNGRIDLQRKLVRENEVALRIVSELEACR
jgi:hypothetical protein